jgi:hypothetical protein
MRDAKNSTEHGTGNPDDKADLSSVPLDEELAGDTAQSRLTRQVLWKMDVRYCNAYCVLDSVFQSTDQIQTSTHPCAALPLLLHRPHQCRQRKNPGTPGRYPPHRPPICDRAVCVLCYLYCKVGSHQTTKLIALKLIGTKRAPEQFDFEKNVAKDMATSPNCSLGYLDYVSWLCN